MTQNKDKAPEHGGEYILCAAIWYKKQPTPKIQVLNIDEGLVMCGHRHGHIIHQFVALTGKRSIKTECGEYVQGFITNTDRFVDRKEAALIAICANQVNVTKVGKELFSEDLY